MEHLFSLIANTLNIAADVAAMGEVAEQITGYRCLTWQDENASILSLFARIGYIVFSLVAFAGLIGQKASAVLFEGDSSRS